MKDTLIQEYVAYDLSYFPPRYITRIEASSNMIELFDGEYDSTETWYRDELNKAQQIEEIECFIGFVYDIWSEMIDIKFIKTLDVCDKW